LALAIQKKVPGPKEKGICKKVSWAFRGTTKFEGRIQALKAAVFNFISLCQPELYVRTTGEIADYVGKTLKYWIL